MPDLKYICGLTNSKEIVSEIEWRDSRLEIEEGLHPPDVIGVEDNTRASFPLKLRHADSYIAERIALLGDAAHVMHPLAGQGLNQGMLDVQALCEILQDCKHLGQDIGSVLTLEPYATKRYLENHIIMGVVDKLHKLYSIESGPLVTLRSWGLEVVNELDRVKAAIMQQASGK